MIVNKEIEDLHAKPLRSLNAQEMNKLTKYYSKDSVKADVDAKIKALRIEMGLNKIFTLDDLKEIQTYIWDRFNYTPDETAYKYDDFWSTLAFDMLMHKGKLNDDCDGFGFAILEMCYRVALLPKDKMQWASCKTETGEGHFVSWITITSHTAQQIVYQVENRYPEPRTIKFFKEMGYEYLYYANIATPMKLYKAKAKIAQLLYDTPTNADEPTFTLNKVIRIDKSKTLLKEWIGVATGALVILKDNANEVVNTLQANQSNLSSFLEPQIVGSMMVVLSLIGIYLRTITNKDIDVKRNYDG